MPGVGCSFYTCCWGSGGSERATGCAESRAQPSQLNDAKNNSTSISNLGDCRCFNVTVIEPLLKRPNPRRIYWLAQTRRMTKDKEFYKAEIANIMREMIRIIDQRSNLEQNSHFDIDWPEYCRIGAPPSSSSSSSSSLTWIGRRQ